MNTLIASRLRAHTAEHGEGGSGVWFVDGVK